MADIFTVLLPTLAISKVVGLGPFFIDKKRKELKVSKVGLAISVIMLTLFSLNAGFFMYTKVIFKDDRIESYISMATDVILLVSGITVTITSVVFTIVQRNKIIRVVASFYNVGFEMNKLNELMPYKSVLKYAILYLAVLFVVIAALLIHSIVTLQGINIVICSSYLYVWFVPKIYNFLMEYQFVSGALLLKTHFNSLNKCLKKFNETGKTGKNQSRPFDVGIKSNAWVDNFESDLSKKIITHTFSVWDSQTSKYRARKIWSSDSSAPSAAFFLDKIKTIRKIHSSLCEIKEDLNSSYSLQLLTSVAQAFIFITANLYMIFTTLSSSAAISAMQLSYPIIWAIIHSVELIIIVVTCTKTSKTANYTAILVHKLLVKECPTDLRNQLKLFSIQLLHRKISFTAAGFFNLDMTLLQAVSEDTFWCFFVATVSPRQNSMIYTAKEKDGEAIINLGVVGAATTYLVILIQFHNTYEVPQDM